MRPTQSRAMVRLGAAAGVVLVIGASLAGCRCDCDSAQSGPEVVLADPAPMPAGMVGLRIELLPGAEASADAAGAWPVLAVLDVQLPEGFREQERFAGRVDVAGVTAAGSRLPLTAGGESLRGAATAWDGGALVIDLYPHVHDLGLTVRVRPEGRGDWAGTWEHTTIAGPVASGRVRVRRW